MREAVIFTVPLVRGKGRPRYVRQTGRAFTPDKTVEAMERIRMAYLEKAGGKSAPRGAEVAVVITTSRPLPKSRPKRVTQEPDVYKPDIDNITKLVLDALNGVAWADDTQVTELQARKSPRTRRSEELTRVAVIWREGNE